MNVLQKLFQKGLSFVFVAMLVGVAPVAAGQTQQFQPDSYTSVLTNYEIAVSGPEFAIVDAELQHYLDGEGEVIQMENASATNLEVSFYDDSDTPELTIDIYLNSIEVAADEFEVLDRGIDGDYYYALSRVVYQDVEIAYYVQVYEDVEGSVDLLEGILSSADGFEADLIDAQAEVTVGGVMFLENVIPSELAASFVQGAPASIAEDVTPVAAVDTVTLSLTDTEVGVGPDFVIDGDPVLGNDVESIQIEGPGTKTFLAVGHTGSAPSVILDSFATGISNVYVDAEVVDEWSSDGSAWRILSIPRDTDPSTIVLIVADTTSVPGAELVYAHEVPSNAVAGSLITIQSQITVDGQPTMQDIDIEEIAAIVDEWSGEVDTTTEAETPIGTEEANDADKDGTSTNPRDGARLPDPGSDEDEGNTSETDGNPVTPVDTVTPESGAGTLTDSSWEGGVHGHLIEWDATVWFVDPDYPEDIVSNEVNREDAIVLQPTSGSAWFIISVVDADGFTSDDYVDYWISDEYLEAVPEGATLLDSRTRGDGGGTVMQYADETGAEFILVRQAEILENGNLLIITFDTPAADVENVYALAQKVTVDGEPVLSVFSLSQIQRLLGD